jgi:hypothetical protein
MRDSALNGPVQCGPISSGLSARNDFQRHELNLATSFNMLELSSAVTFSWDPKHDHTYISKARTAMVV